MKGKAEQLIELADYVFEPGTAYTTMPDVVAAVLREVSDGLCCGGELYELADEIEGL